LEIESDDDATNKYEEATSNNEVGESHRSYNILSNNGTTGSDDNDKANYIRMAGATLIVPSFR